MPPRPFQRRATDGQFCGTVGERYRNVLLLGIGEIRMVGFDFAPRGWEKCEGRVLPINQHRAPERRRGSMAPPPHHD